MDILNLKQQNWLTNQFDKLVILSSSFRIQRDGRKAHSFKRGIKLPKFLRI